VTAWGQRVVALLRSQVGGALLVVLVLAAGVAITTDRFLLADNLRNVGLQVAIVAIIAIGATIVILTAQIDLSSGSLVALTTVVAADLIKNQGVPVALAIPTMILMGAALGAGNGFFSSYGRIPSFIFTLGTLSIFRGLALLYTGGTPIFEVSPDLDPIFYGTVLGVPNAFLYVIALYAIGWAYLRHTRGGREIYAVGGNEDAARLAGINVNRVRTRAFVIAGALGAVGGVLMTARLDSGSPNYGQGMELMAIAAAVIGGASLFGGQGSLVATLFGALTIVIVQNALNLHDVATAWQSVTLGGIIAVAVAFDMWRGDIARGVAALWRRLPGSDSRSIAVGEENVRPGS
jgi:ribose transport system permease protein